MGVSAQGCRQQEGKARSFRKIRCVCWELEQGEQKRILKAVLGFLLNFFFLSGHHVVEDGFECLLLLPPPPECWIIGTCCKAPFYLGED